MPNRHVGKILYTLFLSCLLVSAFYLTTILLRTLAPARPAPSSATQVVTKTDIAPPVRINPPSRLEIATINVNAAVKPVGLTVEGNMAIDENINDVAWYDLGSRPGEIGSAVIAGHYGWKNGQASVFNDLHTLIAGDRVSVYGANNEPISFIVQRTQSYDPAAEATEVFQSSDSKAHLNLITCKGSWNSGQQTYSERLVVFTDKEV